MNVTIKDIVHYSNGSKAFDTVHFYLNADNGSTLLSEYVSLQDDGYHIETMCCIYN